MRMFIRFRRSLAFAAAALVGVLPSRAFAGLVSGGLKQTGHTSQLKGIGGGRIEFFAANIIGQVIGVIGVVFLILIIYSGFLWMTAGGNEERVSKAKKIITGSVIGLMLIFSAYFITELVYEAFYTYEEPDAGAS